MLKASAKQYLKKSLRAVLRRLPHAMRLRLCCELAALLGDQAIKVPPVLMGRLAPADRVLLVREAFKHLHESNSKLDVYAALLTELSTTEQLPFLRALALRMDAKPMEVLTPLLTQLSRAEKVSMLEQLAGVLEISAAEVSGTNGRLTGYFGDQGVFLPYLDDRSWFWNAVEFISSIFADRAGGTFIDIGANIGAVVVPVARANPLIDCFAFEPEPDNFLALAHNIARNRVSKNIKAYALALTDVDGPMTFELSAENFGDHRVRKSEGVATPMFNEEGRATIEVEGRRLDAVLAPGELVRPIVGKIDVQGAEPMVLAGGETILREAEILIVEYWPYGMRRLGRDPVEFLDGFARLFPWVARVGDRPIAWTDFVSFAAMRADLQAFADQHSWMHLNLALMKHPMGDAWGP